MAVNNVASSLLVQGDGVKTSFDFTFRVVPSSQVRLKLVDDASGAVTIPSPSTYTVTFNDLGNGGTLTTAFAEPVPVGTSLFIYRETPLNQLAGVTGQTAYDPKVVEAVWDKLTVLIQEVVDLLSRTVQVNPGQDPTQLVNSIFTAVMDSAASAQAAQEAEEAAMASLINIQGSFANTRAALVATDPSVLKTAVFNNSIWVWDPNITPAMILDDPAESYFIPPVPGANGAWVRNRMVYTGAGWTFAPDGNYIDIPQSNQERLRWINTSGGQEKNTDGNYDGSYSPGKMPPGRSRLSRTGAAQMYLSGRHVGFGDGYNLNLFMAGVYHGAPLSEVTRWSGRNSAGLLGGQVNAGSDDINLYATGDIVMNDLGRANVAMLGDTRIAYYDGETTVSYPIPRYMSFMISNGSKALQSAYRASGKFEIAVDLTGVQASTNYGVLLPAGGRIGFNGVANSDVAVNPTLGNCWMALVGALLTTVVDNHAVLTASGDRVSVQPATQNANAFRVRGASLTASMDFGQIGNIGYLTINSTATDNTSFVIRTASAGTESDTMLFRPAGTINTPRLATYANNAAAIAGGLTTHDWYKTATGELRIVV